MKTTILSFIKKIKYRMSVNILIVMAVRGGIAGFLMGFFLSLAAVWIPIYRSGFYSILIGVLGVLGGIIYGVFQFPTLKHAALTGDSKGLQESLITALEFKDSEDTMHLLQREQTMERIKKFDVKKQVPYLMPWKSFGILSLFIFLCILCTMIPSEAKKIAEENQVLKEIIKEQENQIEQVKKEIKEENLSELQREQLQKLLETAMEELQKIESPEEIEKVMERLDVKLEKEKQLQADKDFSEVAQGVSEKLNLPSESKKLEEVKALAEKIEEELQRLDTTLTQEELEQLSKELAKQLNEGDLSKEQLEQLAEATGMSSEQLSTSLSNASASISKTASANTSGNSNQSGESGQSGEGEPSGQSGEPLPGQSGGAGQAGQGEQSGQGTNGNDGSGSGWNQGSKSGFEKANSSAKQPEQLDIPNRILGNDENLTGSPSGNGSSYITDSETGLAYAGQKTDYQQVVGSYTSEAYSKIDNSSIPDNLKDIVKDYFSGLNE